MQNTLKKLIAGGYTADTGIVSSPDSLNKYLKAVADGASSLDFVLYSPNLNMFSLSIVLVTPLVSKSSLALPEIY